MAFEAETHTKQPEVDGAEEVHRQMQAALIFDNKHSTVSMEVSLCACVTFLWREGGRERGRDTDYRFCCLLQGLRANWTGLLLAIQRAKNETENQILIRDSKGLSEEQIKEYRQSFDHFDRVSTSHTHTHYIHITY